MSVHSSTVSFILCCPLFWIFRIHMYFTGNCYLLTHLHYFLTILEPIVMSQFYYYSEHLLTIYLIILNSVSKTSLSNSCLRSGVDIYQVKCYSVLSWFLLWMRGIETAAVTRQGQTLVWEFVSNIFFFKVFPTVQYTQLNSTPSFVPFKCALNDKQTKGS